MGTTETFLLHILVTLTFYICSNISCPEGYSQCAIEGQTCYQTGVIAYGAGSKYTYQSSLSTITCNIAAFGADPTPTLTNECCSQSPTITGIKTPIVGKISCGQTIYSHFGYMTDKHYWKLTTNGQFDILYTTCESLFDTRINIYNSANTIISLTQCPYVTDTTKTGDDCNENVCTLQNNNEYFTLNTQVAGIYYVEIISYDNDGKGDYQLRVACSPTLAPTSHPIASPTSFPSHNPTISPSKHPSRSPTLIPTITPTVSPTKIPTSVPSVSPVATKNPTVSPTEKPTKSPTTSPTMLATTRYNDAKQSNENGNQSNSNIVAIIVPLLVVLCCCMVIILGYYWHRKQKHDAVEFAAKVKNIGETQLEGVNVTTNGTNAPPGTTPIGATIEMQSVSENNQANGQLERINSMSSIGSNVDSTQPALTMEQMQQHMIQMQQTMNNTIGGNMMYNNVVPMTMVDSFQNNGMYNLPAQYNANPGSSTVAINPNDVKNYGNDDNIGPGGGIYKTEGQ